jgi:hypothetical protein
MTRTKNPATKVCSECGESLTLDKYYRDTRRIGTPGEYRDECRRCAQRIRKEHGNTRAEKLLQNYRLSEADYNYLVELQRGVCAGCRRSQASLTRPLVVDHSHTTGMLRGLLCYSCNQVLGLVEDNPFVLEGLAAYLRSEGFVGEESDD